MSKREDGGPAFPVPAETDGEWNHPSCTQWREYRGMTLRDWFAGQALAGMFAADTSESVIEPHKKARLAYEAADATLAERDR